MNTTPIRHGDWHVIDGQLIDLSQTPAPELPPEVVTGSDVDDETPPPSLPPSSPASKRRNTSSREH